MSISRLNREVGEEYGKILPIRVVENGAPNFDWNTVNIPARLVEENDELILKNMLRHEYGHLFINPRSLAVGETMFYLAKSVGFKKPNIAVNIVSDLIVDYTLMTLHGKEYLSMLEHYLSGADEQSLRLMAAFYGAHAKALGIPTVLHTMKSGDTLYRILSDETVPLYRRVYSALLFLRRVLGDSLSLGGHSRTRIVISSVNIASVERELRRDGVHLKERRDSVFHVPGHMEMFSVMDSPADIAMVELELETLYDFDELGNTRNILYDTWMPGDPPSSYSPVKTIENTGIAIPGITTVARVEKKLSGANGPRDVVIVLDCSGSMNGEKFRAAQIAVLNILGAAKRAGVRVGFVPFSAFVDDSYVIYPTTNYDELRSLLLRIVPNGGTMLGRAVERAAQMAPGRVYIITDTHVSDETDVLNALDGVEKVVYVIEDSSGVRSWVREADRFYVVSPRELMVVSREVM